MRVSSVARLFAFLLLSCGMLLAQDATAGVYSVTYFDNNLNDGCLDSTVRIINPGVTGSPISPDQGTLCANLYIFDDTQEMVECCSCPITANELLTLSVQDLTENPLTVTPYRGVIKLVASFPKPTCDPTQINLNDPPNLRGISTHIQTGGTTTMSPINGGNSDTIAFVTEDEFADAPLNAVEQRDLATICSFVRYLGTGRGRCDDECDEPIGGD